MNTSGEPARFHELQWKRASKILALIKKMNPFQLLFKQNLPCCGRVFTTVLVLQYLSCPWILARGINIWRKWPCHSNTSGGDCLTISSHIRAVFNFKKRELVLRMHRSLGTHEHAPQEMFPNTLEPESPDCEPVLTTTSPCCRRSVIVSQ